MSSKVSFPLSGLRQYSNPFSLPGLESNGELVKASYDLRSVLLNGARTPGWEADVHQEIAKQVPNLHTGGLFVPWEVFMRSDTVGATRDLSVTGGASVGGDFVETFREPRIVDALRPVSQVIASGATVLDKLTSNVSFPRWQTASSPSGYAETTLVSDNAQTTSIMNLSAHRISSMTIVSKQLLIQGANLGLEELIKKEMLRSIGSVIDQYALVGSGVGQYPFGILNVTQNSGGGRDLGKIQPAVTFGGTASWANVCAFPGVVESTDIQDDGTFGWIVSPATKQKWSTTPKITAEPHYLYENGKVGDNPLRASNNLASTNQAIFARWSDVVIGLWPLSVLVDPFTLS
jgi:hypothetical protein